MEHGPFVYVFVQFLCHVLFMSLLNGMQCEIISCRKSADVRGQTPRGCCTDATGIGETVLNSTQLICIEVNQSSPSTVYLLSL